MIGERQSTYQKQLICRGHKYTIMKGHVGNDFVIDHYVVKIFTNFSSISHTVLVNFEK